MKRIFGRMEQKNLYLQELGSWSRHTLSDDSRKTILLMDSSLQVYKDKDSLRSTNADDLFELLKDTRTRLIRDIVDSDLNLTESSSNPGYEWEWNRYLALLQLRPDLIIIHMSAFELPAALVGDCLSGREAVVGVGVDRGEYMFEMFLDQINKNLPGTKILVYSRRIDLPEKASMLQEIYKNISLEYLYVKPRKTFVFNMDPEFLSYLKHPNEIWHRLPDTHQFQSDIEEANISEQAAEDVVGKVYNKKSATDTVPTVANGKRIQTDEHQNNIAKVLAIDIIGNEIKGHPRLIFNYLYKYTFKLNKQGHEKWLLQMYQHCDDQEDSKFFREFSIEQERDKLKVYEVRNTDFRDLHLSLLVRGKVKQMLALE